MRDRTCSDLNIAVGDYLPVIRKIARALAPIARECDAMGCTRDDYEQQLSLAAVQARLTFRERYGFCTPQERRFVYRSLWNLARDRRSERWGRMVRRRDFELEIGNQHLVTGGAYNPEPQYWARLWLWKAIYKARRDQGMVVYRLSKAGGAIKAAYQTSDGSMRTWRRRVDSVLASLPAFEGR